VDLREIRSEAVARHPWERARARFFVDSLAEAQLLERPINVIDVGSGDAFFASELAQRLPQGSRVVCCDSNYTDDHIAGFAQQYGTGALSFVRTLPAERFDLLVLLDVIEHVADDRGFLRGLVANQLVDRGHALISVPAWMALFVSRDVGVVHHRRYRPAQLTDVITSSGLDTRVSGGLFHSLLLPRALQKLAERARGINSVPAPDQPPAVADSDISDWHRGAALTAAVNWALRADNALSALCARMNVPLPGLSAWALARRR
jgi:hypothetical protein